ncbi:hypothetical protein GOM44_01775 [Wolbachia endosymbiont of Atemnus politus]|uniref:hypothetical protein n=1 Tax=Wolbachia endosymbiont of Atemnus politus TaxID=2682840 RepID=UPI0015730D71|nr:hypothetical protein [Wolbachia endosymbiont of Atemnus politus]NSX83214.1 hypothetical protein [Wolbachia endosymbiont of Atemnus politus]
MENGNVEKFVEETDGFSGADLEYLVNKAKLSALKQISDEDLKKCNVRITVTIDDFNSALEDLKKKKNEHVSSNTKHANVLNNVLPKGHFVLHKRSLYALMLIHCVKEITHKERIMAHTSVVWHPWQELLLNYNDRAFIFS